MTCLESEYLALSYSRSIEALTSVTLVASSSALFELPLSVGSYGHHRWVNGGDSSQVMLAVRRGYRGNVNVTEAVDKEGALGHMGMHYIHVLVVQESLYPAPNPVPVDLDEHFA